MPLPFAPNVRKREHGADGRFLPGFSDSTPGRASAHPKTPGQGRVRPIRTKLRPAELEGQLSTVGPRWQTPLPTGATHSWGPIVARHASKAYGLDLLLWQRDVINQALACDPSGAIVHRLYTASSGRQNGKTALCRALIGWAMEALPMPLSWSTVMGVAYDRKQATRLYHSVAGDLAGRPGMAVTAYQGIRSADGRLYDVASRQARDNLRGVSIDLAVFDEVGLQRTTALWAALLPTIVTRPMPLILGISSAGDANSVLLREWFDRGQAVSEGRVPGDGFGMTWYAPDINASADDPDAWLAANPAMAEGLLGEQAIRLELASTLPSDFRRERLNLWADASTDWLPPALWRSLARPDARYDLERPIVLAVDVVPSWERCTIVVAGYLQGLDIPHVAIAGEVDAIREGRDRLAPSDLLAVARTAVERWSPAMVVYDRAAGAAAHLEGAGAAGWPVIPLDARKIAAASMAFEAHALGGELSHAGDDVMAMHLRASARSPLGDSWRLSRRQSAGHIDSIVAAAMALYALTRPEEVQPLPSIW